MSNYDSIYNRLNVRLEKELNSLDTIICSKEAHDLVKADRVVYYNTAISSLASLIIINCIRKDSVTSKRIMEMWKTSSIDYIKGQGKLQFTTSFFALLGRTTWFGVYNQLDINEFREIYSDKIKNNLRHMHTLSLSQKFLPTEV